MMCSMETFESTVNKSLTIENVDYSCKSKYPIEPYRSPITGHTFINAYPTRIAALCILSDKLDYLVPYLKKDPLPEELINIEYLLVLLYNNNRYDLIRRSLLSQVSSSRTDYIFYGKGLIDRDLSNVYITYSLEDALDDCEIVDQIYITNCGVYVSAAFFIATRLGTYT